MYIFGIYISYIRSSDKLCLLSVQNKNRLLQPFFFTFVGFKKIVLLLYFTFLKLHFFLNISFSARLCDTESLAHYRFCCSLSTADSPLNISSIAFPAFFFKYLMRATICCSPAGGAIAYILILPVILVLVVNSKRWL